MNALDEAFELAPASAMSIEVEHLAPHLPPVIVVDGLYKSPERLRDVALGLDYNRTRGGYPGAEAKVHCHSLRVYDLLKRLILRHLGHRAEHVVNPFWSVPVPKGERLTRKRAAPTVRSKGLRLPPADETIVFTALTRMHDDRLPHFDSGPSVAAAAVVYLNLPEQCRGGTAIFRHRRTGLIAAPMGAEAAEVARRFGFASPRELYRAITWLGTKGQRPIATHGDWEIVKLVEMKFNRLVLYDALFLHNISGTVNDFGSTLDTCRLTQNVFMGHAVNRLSPWGAVRALLSARNALLDAWESSS